MTPEETLRLFAVVTQLCPAQRVDEYTPDAWHTVLGGLQFADCLDAVRRLGRTNTWIGTADIYQEVQRVRTDRKERAGDLPIPQEVVDAGVEAEIAWKRRTWKDIGDGLAVVRGGEVRYVTGNVRSIEGGRG